MNLFSLTMETRFGSNWQLDMSEDAIRALADEIAHGFGATIDAEEKKAGTLWRFPDGSVARTNGTGLRAETKGESDQMAAE
ncbi:MAG: hypothetical protein ACPGOY_10405 [Rhodospirillaceae bacterium]